MTDSQLSAVFLKFVEIIRALRDPKTGCPWDKEQTHDSLRTYLIEECFEAVEAIDSDDLNDLKEELGDVLLQVVLHAQIASESSIFTIEDVIQTVTDKMIRRHPHVFGTEKVEDSAHVLKNWEEIKKAEKASQANNESVKTPFDGIPKSLPALLVSERIGEKAARVKFDWEEISGVLVKVKEEYHELFEALDKTNFSTLTKPSSTPIDSLPGHSPESLNNNHEIGKELGDCLFTLAQLARWLGYSSESLLRETNTRFIERYKRMQASIPPDISPADLQIAWKKAKEEA